MNAWAFLVTGGDRVGAPQYIAQSASGQATTTEWTHLVGTYDPGTTDGMVSLYVNGSLVGTANVPNSASNTWNATGPLTIGAVKTNTAINNQTTGSIAGVGVYPYTLTKDQVATVYRNQ
ncbi:LamG-like jellyroll fold domain-containing protein [Kitasatospora sp. NPDC002227]|uniref:LamG-like jellyroll fold domain-containing protein n=1 Tax=Kitasatospora sp. NPDC002227 TaxID=3154773 RepID=UPI003318E6D5